MEYGRAVTIEHEEPYFWWEVVHRNRKPIYVPNMEDDK